MQLDPETGESMDLEIFGVIGASNHGTAGDVEEAEGSGGLGVGLELFGGDELDNGQVTDGRLQVLAEGQDVAADLTEVIHGGEDFGFGFTEAEHEAGLGVERVLGPLPGFGQNAERTIIGGTMTNGWGEATDRFQVVIENVRLGVEHRLDGIVLVVEVRGQNLDDSAGVDGADGFDGAGKMIGAAVGEVIAGNGRDDDVAQAHPTGGLGEAGRFFGVEWQGFGGGDSAESAGTSAVIAGDHEGGGALAPAFPMVGATGAFADRMKLKFTE
jgi:hypothetical protein